MSNPAENINPKLSGEDYLIEIQGLLDGDFENMIKAADQIVDYKSLHPKESRSQKEADLLEQAYEHLTAEDTVENLATQLSNRSRKEHDDTYIDGVHLLANIIEKKYGFNAKPLIVSWCTRGKGQVVPYRANIEAMQRLEAAQTDSVKFLHDNFGIRNFDRYPPEMLIDQINNQENGKDPYGIIINPVDDYNGSFSLNKAPLRSLYLMAKEKKHGIRVFEVESKQDIARHLIKLDRRYGQHQKIEFAFIGGHGQQDKIFFGGNDARHQLKVDDLMGKGVKKAQNFFVEKPTIVLISCSTGKEDGIGQVLSRDYGATVIAPKQDTSWEDIDVEEDSSGRLAFKIFYSKGASAKYSSGRKEPKS